MPQYQGVWTLEQQAQAQSNQQWVTDPNFKNTTLLLQADNAANGATNNTFLDSSTNSFVVTRNGNTTQGSFTPFSQAAGYWSNYQSAVDTNYLSFTASAGTLFQFAGDFTIEAWVCLATAANGASIWVTNDGSANYFALNLLSANFDIYLNSSSSTNTIPHGLVIGQWAHVAMVRSGSTITVYTNGAAKGTLTNSSTLGYASPSIARNGGGGNVSWYLSNLRIVKSALYTANFTPQTTPLTNVTNTSLLTCQSSRFVDNSSNALVPTVTGTPSVQAFGPFAPALQWTPDVVGGSGYFDGTGDYLLTPSNAAFALGTGQFCLEAWHYPTQTSAGGIILSSRTGSINQASSFTMMQYTGTTYSMYANGNHVLTTMTPFQWNHIIITRDSSNTLRLILNGVLGNYESSYVEDITQTTMGIGALTNGGEPGYGYTTGHRVIKGSIPTTYQTSSTTIGATIYTPPTQPVTLTSQGATSANISYLSNYTNAGIYDGKMANVFETVGNAQVATSPVKYGSGSMYFPTTNGNYCVSPPNQPNFIYGTGNFTVEAWLYPIAFTNVASGAFGYGLSGGAVDWGFEIDTSGNALWVDNNTVRFYASVSLRAGVWTHVAVVRTNTGTTMYYNGVSVGTYSTINNISGTSGARLYVGTGAQVPGSRQFVGFIDDFRVTKGVARYFTTFTPPQQALPRQ